MKQIISISSLAFASCLIAGCGRLPNTPITPDGYRPPKPTKENIISMVRNALKNMIFVEGGSYIMGNTVCFTEKKDELVKRYEIFNILCADDEFPPHEVSLDGYHLSKYEISYYEYDLFTQAVNRPFIQYDYLNPQWWKNRGESKEDIIRKFTGVRTSNAPAAIDWFQATDYCRWLGAVTYLPIDLPTEAEWEYAARSQGQDIPYATDNGKQEFGRNYPTTDDRDIQPVNSFPPNPLGLHHMSGNVAEWVSDWYAEDYYSRSEHYNPEGPNTGTNKVKRGGNFDNSPSGNHVFQRSGTYIDYTHNIKSIGALNIAEGTAITNHGARCAIHLSEPIDINNLKIDLTRPAPDSRAEWLAAQSQSKATDK
ncbi:MAG: formylglycine-generating enzyme family protein [Candidatus Thiodiazotropha sp. (ex Monitilora ramsayi)]|nr:formylglycine-generating enzyme family protein [Candidatus Thiodiazotropha sp. (ex Monitilora ramsayi)]